MKYLILVTAIAASTCLPALSQPTIIGGPIELHNPHRRPAPDATIADKASEAIPPPRNGYSSSSSTSDVSIPPPPPAVAMFVDGPYLFILRGDSLFKYDKNTLILIKSTELPHPVAPSPPPTPPTGDLRTQTPPPLRPAPQFKIGPTF